MPLGINKTNNKRKEQMSVSQKGLTIFFNKLLEGPEPNNETEVEYKVLGPVLEKLGWDTQSQVNWRHQVGESPKTGIVDIALHNGDGRPLVLLEAKAWDSKLTRHLEQIMRYAFHDAAQLCVLTNGREWEFYMPRAQGDVRDRLFASVDITVDTTVASKTLIEFLAASTVLSGEATDAAYSALSTYKAQRMAADLLPQIWEGMRTEPDKTLVRLLAKRVKTETGCEPKRRDLVEVIQAAHPSVR